MPFAAIAPIIGSVAGSAVSALAGRGKKQQFVDTTQEQKQNTSSSGTQDFSNLQETLEDPLFGAFRQALIPMLGQQLGEANKPIYGDAQKAALMNQLNDLASASTESLKQNLARAGALDSGRFATGLGKIEAGRLGQLGSFFSQLPFMESEARQNRMLPWAQLLTNWVGRAPLSQRTTGKQAFQQVGNIEGTSKGNQTMTMPGTPFMQGFLGNIAGDVPGFVTGALGGLGMRQPNLSQVASSRNLDFLNKNFQSAIKGWN